MNGGLDLVSELLGENGHFVGLLAVLFNPRHQLLSGLSPSLPITIDPSVPTFKTFHDSSMVSGQTVSKRRSGPNSASRSYSRADRQVTSSLDAKFKPRKRTARPKLLRDGHSFEVWAKRVARPFGEKLKLRVCCVAFDPQGDAKANQLARIAAESALLQAWSAQFPQDEAPEGGLFRSGAGPRQGQAGKLEWASSLSHSVPAANSVGGLLVAEVGARSRKGQSRVCFGVDIEAFDRKVHPRMLQKICPRLDQEAPAIRKGQVPVLAAWCVKEAVYKADAHQDGRFMADYDWVVARKWGNGWTGMVRARQEKTPRFAVAVRRVEGAWIAMALGFSNPPVNP